MGQASSDSLTYTVKKHDFLSRIGVEYGSPNFWLPIYKANRHKIKNPDLIYPGQILIIPKAVTTSERYIDNRRELTKEETEKKSEENKKMLDAFRKAFTNTVQEEQKTGPQTSPSVDNGLEFGGLIINETKSKIGKDFFHVFYQYWEEPQNAPNFLLTITEQMLPSMGTMISVNLDHRPVFKTRLQPRMESIEQNAKQAVAFSYRALQQKLQTSNALIIY
ncbi:MAG: CsgE family curli-type amyloid fiber assembly protein [Balneolaceae bacterium]|nr:CsgE family curli-type amyloid fiber assembly protein [Balneolaceae bacterium]